MAPCCASFSFGPSRSEVRARRRRQNDARRSNALRFLDDCSSRIFPHARASSALSLSGCGGFRATRWTPPWWMDGLCSGGDARRLSQHQSGLLPHPHSFTCTIRNVISQSAAWISYCIAWVDRRLSVCPPSALGCPGRDVQRRPARPCLTSTRSHPTCQLNTYTRTPRSTIASHCTGCPRRTPSGSCRRPCPPRRMRERCWPT